MTIPITVFNDVLYFNNDVSNKIILLCLNVFKKKIVQL